MDRRAFVARVLVYAAALLVILLLLPPALAFGTEPPKALEPPPAVSSVARLVAPLPGMKASALDLLRTVFRGAEVAQDGNSVMLKNLKVLRKPGTKDRIELPEGTKLHDGETFVAQGEGKNYRVLLYHAEVPHNDTSETPAVLLIVPAEGGEPTDVVDVAEDRFASLSSQFLPLGPDEAFVVESTHSNSNQAYAIQALYHIRKGRLSRVGSVFLLSVFGVCEGSFAESLAWKPEDDPGSPYPRIRATVTVVHGEGARDDCKKKKWTELHEEVIHWNAGQGRYVEPASAFARLRAFNKKNL